MELEELRPRIYQGYENLLAGREQEEIPYPEFLRKGRWIYCTDNIEDEKGEIKGKTYLAAEEISTENIGEDSLGIIVRTGEEGVEAFETYSKRGFKPMFMMPESKGLVVNLTALESNPERLRGYSPKEVVGINFSLFPLLKQKFKELPKDDYLNFYIGRYANLPLFF